MTSLLTIEMAVPPAHSKHFLLLIGQNALLTIPTAIDCNSLSSPRLLIFSKLPSTSTSNYSIITNDADVAFTASGHLLGIADMSST